VSTGTAGDRIATPPLIIGYHRPPMTWGPDGWQRPTSPNGILPVLRRVVAGDPRATWTAALVLDRDGGSVGPVGAARLGTGVRLSLVPVSADDWAGYFHRTSKEALWPLLMSQPDRMRFDPAAWERFRSVNALFAEHIGARAAPGATVWLHDYNLWLVPGRLRAARPDLRIGLFHHTPFPPREVLAALPAVAEVVQSLRCLDWAGFHTRTFAENFRSSLPGPRPTPRTGVHPLGIDWRSVEDTTRTRPRPPLHDGTVVLAVERLDYTKAPVQKIDAIDALLRRHPELRGRVRLRLVCPPPEAGITAYDSTLAELERRIAQVNGTWATPTWTPVEYLPTALGFAEVVDAYLAADVFWVTSLQDGMNLTAKEFVIAHAAAGLAGVLVLSRHTGAAEELGGPALLTDPRSPADLVEVLRAALVLTPAERRARLRRLAEIVRRRSPTRWADQILADIHAPDAVSGAAHRRP
jgi:trehalose-6-phosphate synthase